MQVLLEMSKRQFGRDDQVHLKESEAIAMFDVPLDKIIATVQTTLKRTQGGCDHMLLVGGFGGSDYFIKKMNATFKDSVRQSIISPDYASAAVVQGMYTS